MKATWTRVGTSGKLDLPPSNQTVEWRYVDVPELGWIYEEPKPEPFLAPWSEIRPAQIIGLEWRPL